MIYMKRILFSAYILSAFLFTACEDDQDIDINPNQTGSIELKFDNRINGQALKLGDESYTNAQGESFTVSTLNYFVSNLTLTTQDGRTYTVPQEQSYFLIRQNEESSLRFTLDEVPEGNYTEISFVLGVDSLRSTMGPEARQGVLDAGVDGQAADMYWSWNAGYIFFKFEGSSEAIVQEEANGRFRYHIGGFGGYNPASPTQNNLREVRVSMADMAAEVREENTPSVHLIANIEKVFNSPNTFSLAENPVIMVSELSPKVADNYQGMFRVDHVH